MFNTRDHTNSSGWQYCSQVIQAVYNAIAVDTAKNTVCHSTDKLSSEKYSQHTVIQII